MPIKPFEDLAVLDTENQDNGGLDNVAQQEDIVKLMFRYLSLKYSSAKFCIRFLAVWCLPTYLTKREY